MKKILFLCSLILFVGGTIQSTSAWADSLIGDIDDPDIGAYWVGSDDNPSDSKELINSNPETEEAWLEAILGGEDVVYVDKDEAAPINDAEPAEWDYAIVKWGNVWYAFKDNADDNILQPELTGWDNWETEASHTSYFVAAPVPEPATMLLLGVGLLGLVGFRKKFTKE